jgi:SAM-dependent methyltransferase
MNIITLLSLLERNGKKVEIAYGTDFSERLINAANVESKTLLTPEQYNKVHFVVARNEQLISDLSAALDLSRDELMNSFHVILGVNTFRYCHRLGKALQCAQDIAHLLRPGGICINIDMNRRFPAFRSKWRSSRNIPAIERYLPSLDEYASPFDQAGLEILRKENFCWIPHSASRTMTSICGLLAPALNIFAKPWAMRSLVISRKRM